MSCYLIPTQTAREGRKERIKEMGEFTKRKTVQEISEDIRDFGAEVGRRLDRSEETMYDFLQGFTIIRAEIDRLRGTGGMPEFIPDGTIQLKRRLMDIMNIIDNFYRGSGESWTDLYETWSDMTNDINIWFNFG